MLKVTQQYHTKYPFYITICIITLNFVLLKVILARKMENITVYQVYFHKKHAIQNELITPKVKKLLI